MTAQKGTKRDSAMTALNSILPKRDLMPAERQEIILNILTRQNSVTVAELTKLLKTTDITVRRDLATLSQAGLLKRVRGGAMSVSSSARPAAVVAQEIDATHPLPPSADAAETSPQPDAETAGATKAIGVMLPEPSFFWPGVIDHMRSFAADYHMRLIIRESAYDQDIHEERILDDLASIADVCGIVCAPTSKPFGCRTWDWIKQAPVPVVVVERDEPPLSGCHVDSIRTNHPCSASKAALHFLSHGHTRIGAAFTLTPTSPVIAEGWRYIIKQTDAIDCPFVFEQIPPYDTKGVADIVNAILDTDVTAMFIHSDYLAIAVAQALELHGKKVPEDVSMISVDGFAAASTRPLTVLRSPSADLAQLAIETLLLRTRRPEAATRHILIDPQLIDRGSVNSL